MADCKTCEHSVFNELWGEYKCKIFKKRIYDTYKIKIAGCPSYAEDKKKKES